MIARGIVRLFGVLTGSLILLAAWPLLADDERRPRRTNLLQNVMRLIGELSSDPSSDPTGGGKSTKSYLKDLEAKEPGLRREAVKALGQAADGAHVPALLPLLKDPDAEVRTLTAVAFARVGPKARAAMPGLVESARDGDAGVRAAALAALAALEPPVETALPVYGAALADAEPLVRQAAAIAAASLGPQAKSLRANLRALLKDQQRDVKTAAIFALGQLGGAGVDCGPALQALLADQDLYVKAEAAAALWNQTRAPEHLKTLEEFIGNKDLKVREFAGLRLTCVYRGIAQADIQQAINLLRQAEVSALKRFMIDALGDLPSERTFAAADVVVENLSDRNLRPAAQRELTKHGGRVVPVLLPRLKDTDDAVRRETVVILGMIGEPAKAAVPDLAAALKDNSASVRQAAAQALGQLGGDAKAALPALREVLEKDRQNQVRHLANVAIAQIEGQPIPDGPPPPLPAPTKPEAAKPAATKPAETKPAGTAPVPKTPAPTKVDP
jgi:HEAT repeat protein